MKEAARARCLEASELARADLGNGTRGDQAREGCVQLLAAEDEPLAVVDGIEEIGQVQALAASGQGLEDVLACFIHGEATLRMSSPPE